MFVVDDATAEAIRRAYDEGGELSGIVEFRRHFPLITDHAKAGECVRIIAGWRKVPDQPPQRARPHRTSARELTEGEGWIGRQPGGEAGHRRTGRPWRRAALASCRPDREQRPS